MAARTPVGDDSQAFRGAAAAGGPPDLAPLVPWRRSLPVGARRRPGSWAALQLWISQVPSGLRQAVPWEVWGSPSIRISCSNSRQ